MGHRYDTTGTWEHDMSLNGGYVDKMTHTTIIIVVSKVGHVL